MPCCLFKYLENCLVNLLKDLNNFCDGLTFQWMYKAFFLTDHKKLLCPPGSYCQFWLVYLFIFCHCLIHDEGQKHAANLCQCPIVSINYFNLSIYQVTHRLCITLFMGRYFPYQTIPSSILPTTTTVRNRIYCVSTELPVHTL